MEFLSYLISGISLGSVYAIIALGYTMVYGIAKMLNFAHGDVIMIGGYYRLLRHAAIWGCPTSVAVLAGHRGLHGAGRGHRAALPTSRCSTAPPPGGADHRHRRELFPPERRRCSSGAQPRRVYPPVVEPGSMSAARRQADRLRRCRIVTIAACVVIMIAPDRVHQQDQDGQGHARLSRRTRRAAQLMGINVNAHHHRNLRHRLGAGGHRGRAALLVLSPRSCPPPAPCPASRPSPRRCSAASAPFPARSSAAFCSA